MTEAELFDSHFHIVDPRFPLRVNQGYLPDPFTVSDYQAALRGLRVTGGTVVSGSFQGFDQSYLRDALGRLGAGFVGVTQLPPTVSDAELLELDQVGVRGLRFNLYRGASAGVDSLEWLADRVHELVGWHVEVYLSGRHLTELEPRLRSLPRLSIDHLGFDREGLPALLRLVARGARVKATGFGRVELDVSATLRAIADINPGALLFGTDLPGTRARRPFARTDIDLVREALDPQEVRQALHDNASAWYQPFR